MIAFNTNRIFGRKVIAFNTTDAENTIASNINRLFGTKMIQCIWWKLKSINMKIFTKKKQTRS